MPVGELLGGRSGVTVLLGVGTMPVAILEVDPEVLDGLPSQFLGHETMNRIGQRGGDVENRSQVLGGRGPAVESVQRQLAQSLSRVGREEMSTAIHGVHWLAFGALAGEIGAQPGGHLSEARTPAAQ